MVHGNQIITDELFASNAEKQVQKEKLNQRVVNVIFQNLRSRAGQVLLKELRERHAHLAPLRDLSSCVEEYLQYRFCQLKSKETQLAMGS